MAENPADPAQKTGGASATLQTTDTDQAAVTTDRITAKTTLTVGAGGLDFVTPEGRLLARLSEAPGGGAQFTLYGPNGVVSLSAGTAGADVMVLGGSHAAPATSARASLSASGSGGAVSLGGQPGLEGVRMQAHPEGNHLSLLMPGGRPGVSLGTHAEGGTISAATAGGQEVARISAGEEGGMLEVWAGDGRLSAVLGSDQGDGGLVILDRGGARIFAVPVWKFAGIKPAVVEPAASASTEEGAEKIAE